MTVVQQSAAGVAWMAGFLLWKHKPRGIQLPLRLFSPCSVLSCRPHSTKHTQTQASLSIAGFLPSQTPIPWPFKGTR